jgi:hypothetical protein
MKVGTSIRTLAQKLCVPNPILGTSCAIIIGKMMLPILAPEVRHPTAYGNLALNQCAIRPIKGKKLELYVSKI